MGSVAMADFRQFKPITATDFLLNGIAKLTYPARSSFSCVPICMCALQTNWANGSADWFTKSGTAVTEVRFLRCDRARS